MTRRGLGYVAAAIFQIPLATFAFAVPAAADGIEGVHVFSIKAQPLADALLEFSRQAEQQVVSASDVIGTQQTRGVTGRLTSKAALEQLLLATGLTFEVVDERTVRIYATSVAAPYGTRIEQREQFVVARSDTQMPPSVSSTGDTRRRRMRCRRT